MIEIPLSRRLIAIIDDCDADLVMKHKWHATRNQKYNTSTAYARTNIKDPVTGKVHSPLLHRFILGLSDKSILVDHRDGNGLNNCRSNLRESSFAQNCWNRKTPSNSPTQFKGVRWRKDRSRWVAAITFNGKVKILGSFISPEDAAREYDKGARIYHGEFAKTNF